jgi:hypothetical protein
MIIKINLYAGITLGLGTQYSVGVNQILRQDIDDVIRVDKLLIEFLDSCCQ